MVLLNNNLISLRRKLHSTTSQLDVHNIEILQSKMFAQIKKPLFRARQNRGSFFGFYEA